MGWVTYNILFAVVYMLLMPRYLVRMWRRGGYRRGFLQRVARYEPEVLARLKARRRIWIHAVSVGEIGVALKFMEELRRASGCSFVLSTTTSTGFKVAEPVLNADDVLIYYPADFPVVVKKALAIIKPQALLLTESELWPNMIRLARAGGIPVAVINGRISDSSYSGYSRLAKSFVGSILKSINLMLVQTQVDRDRLISLGADPVKVIVAGNSKYDIAPGDASGEARGRGIVAAAGIPDTAELLLGGSTWPGEEKILLDIYAKLKRSIPGLHLVLVPRHMERRAGIEAEISAAGLSYVKRTDMNVSGWSRPAVAPDVLLVDTTGELRCLYSCASAIFVGKSLTQHGGQNVIEPAMAEKAIVVGPNMENFAGVMADFLAAGALIQVKDQNGLEAAISALLMDQEKRNAIAAKAKAVVAANRGATARTAAEIVRMLSAVPPSC